jgi:hypothetical protein
MAAPATTIGSGVTYDANGNPKGNVPVFYQIQPVASSSAGTSLDTETNFVISNYNTGSYSIQMVQSRTAIAYRGSFGYLNPTTINAPSGQGTFTLPEIDGPDDPGI